MLSVISFSYAFAGILHFLLIPNVDNINCLRDMTKRVKVVQLFNHQQLKWRKEASTAFVNIKKPWHLPILANPTSTVTLPLTL